MIPDENDYEELQKSALPEEPEEGDLVDLLEEASDSREKTLDSLFEETHVLNGEENEPV